MAKAIMILGTGSDVGKSLVVTAICRILKRRGIKVAPFKAQNMSNNSYVTVEGGEIGRAQAVQAEAAEVLPSVHMNPVLLKPSGKKGSQVILQGKVFCNISAKDYPLIKSKLKEAILDSYHKLSEQYEVIVIEGAGSCCEMNIKKNDIANLFIAKQLNINCILVGDIDKGGIFAQLIGTYLLMDKDEKALVKGFLINKFRGDPSLFTSGIRYIEKYTSVPVLGLIPYIDNLHIYDEDSVAVQKEKYQNKPLLPDTINIAVVRFPAISNFTDMEVLSLEKDVVLNYLFSPKELSDMYDCIILPGTKNVIEDAIWIKKSGWAKKIKEFAKKGGIVLGICGGYQILGKRIKDPYRVESDKEIVNGIGLLPIETVLEKEKTVRKVKGRCLLNNKKVEGYEIHMGRTFIIEDKGSPFLRLSYNKESWKDGWVNKEGNVFGTYLHGLMDTDGFREEFLNRIRAQKGLKPKKARRLKNFRLKEYDKLASVFERHCNIEEIIRFLK